MWLKGRCCRLMFWHTNRVFMVENVGVNFKFDRAEVGLAGVLVRCLWFHPPPLSSCFPPEFLPLRRWAEFHTGLDASFVGFVST